MSSRQERRKATTRAKLIDAARELFADKGIDATRINEITDTADVGFGSFYSHFDGKDAIVAAVIEQTAREAAAEIDAITTGIEDPAEVVAVAHRFLVLRAAEDPAWGWLLVRLELSHDLAIEAFGPYALRDIDRGVAAGRFDVEDTGIALVAAGGALLGVIRAVLQGRADKTTAARQHAAGVLRLYGVPPSEAAEIVTRPLP
jgi:AcrR family transcriptional regulator